MSTRPHNYGTIIPVPNSQVLQECLANGQLDVATALAQTNQFVCETLKTIEEFTEGQAKLYLQSKLKMDKMDKLIDELSEKCQAMQQALLFKEEKYDEKCREVTRYKMICEMAAKEAKKPLVIDKQVHDVNNNLASTYGEDEQQQQQCRDRVIKLEKLGSTTSSCLSKRNTVKHTKFNKNEVHISNRDHQPQRASAAPTMAYYQSQLDTSDERKFMAPYYAGGPSKRRASSVATNDNPHESGSRVKQRLELIGGINVSGPQLDTGPVPFRRLVSESPYNEESNKWARIDVTGQRNEVFSSSGNNAQRMKQKIVEKDLHKQVSSGSWNRLASRRKKDWPF